MAAIEHLDIIKTLAKKFARARRTKHIEGTRNDRSAVAAIPTGMP